MNRTAYRLSDIVARFGGRIVGDAETRIDQVATLDDAGYKFGQPYLGIGGISTYGGTDPTDDIVPFIFDNFKSTGLTLPYGG